MERWSRFAENDYFSWKYFKNSHNVKSIKYKFCFQNICRVKTVSQEICCKKWKMLSSQENDHESLFSWRDSVYFVFFHCRKHVFYFSVKCERPPFPHQVIECPEEKCFCTLSEWSEWSGFCPPACMDTGHRQNRIRHMLDPEACKTSDIPQSLLDSRYCPIRASGCDALRKKHNKESWFSGKYTSRHKPSK